MKLKLGFSTGAFHQEFSTKKALAFLKNLGIKVVELGFVKMERFQQGWVDDLTEKDLNGFDYISVHAPIIKYGKNSETEYVFDKLNKINNLRKLDLAIFHPDTVEDFSVFNNLDFSVGFENMDNRKITYKTSEEMEKLLKHNNYNLVLDVNHVFTNDKTMNLAKQFQDKLGYKIKEIHLSGCTTHHDSLFQTKQKEIIESIRDFNIPIINEATINSEDAEKEIDYITKEIERIITSRDRDI
ncbi:MAG: hypothetical protein Q8N88_01100 [Nanoarchaeota archaeon]|nr:hypothetical protein [Nanoarchaeota archaeon]